MTRPTPRGALAAAILLLQLAAPLRVAAQPERLPNGVVVAVRDAHVLLEFCGDRIVRVARAPERAFFARPSLAAAPKACPATKWELTSDAAHATIASPVLRARVDLATGAVSVLDVGGRPVLAERAGGATLTAADVQGARTFHVRQEWEPHADEALYGLGQHQLGLMNIKGYDIDLWQHNATVSVPVFVSSRGYGVLWDNPSYTRFGDIRPFEPIPPAQLRDAAGKPGGLTGSYFAGAAFERQVATRVDPRIDIEIPGGTPNPNARIHPDLPDGEASVRWEGAIVPETTGDHLIRTYSNAGIRLWIDDRLLVDHWRQGWLPWYDLARVRMEAGKPHRVRLEWRKDQGMETMRLQWKTPAPSPSTALWSEVGEGIDYYVLHGPALDDVIAGYRQLTGQAPMMPLWTFGLWQSRERYRTAQESLDALEGFRSRGIPIDAIVQDWQYWPDDQWGSHAFDATRFPDPEGWIRAIHDKYHARLMISVWPKFYPGTENFDALQAAGLLYPRHLKEKMLDWLGYPYTFYDAFSEQGRKLFWSQMERDLFRKGVDAWWLDATEPDLVQPMPTLEGQRDYMHPTALGPGSRVLNAYSLLNSQAVYEGQRAASPDQRVFILTRSGYAGQQRYAAATWSGDVTSTWTAFRAQIPAGLSFSLSGLPYWTTDIGGFSVPPRFARETPTPDDAEEWRELNTRWFQFGTFCPLTRVHGQAPVREMWSFGGESHPAYRTQLRFDRLRYRMLPYVYALAGAVTHRAGTMMRALVMDFPDDAQVRDMGDQYLFGPAFLVSPVTTYKARSRPVYLPAGSRWYDFWTGASHEGGRTIEAAAPFETLPVHVRAGAIVPFGPERQWTTEKPSDPLTVFVYAGADGAFTLYEDDGLTYGYERGAAARIPLRWTDATRTLSLGPREGSFPAMLAERTVHVVLVAADRAVGFSFDPRPDRTVQYRGTPVEVKLP